LAREARKIRCDMTGSAAAGQLSNARGDAVPIDLDGVRRTSAA